MFLGCFIILCLTKVCHWVLPQRRLVSVVSYGDWLLSSEERGHVLTTSACLDKECVIKDDIQISCLDVNGADETLSISAFLPNQYSNWFDNMEEGNADLVLNDVAQRVRLGQIRITIIPDKDFAMVELRAVATPLTAVLSSTKNQMDFLKVEGPWPIRFQIPLLGLADGLAGLTRRCGGHWKLP